MMGINHLETKITVEEFIGRFKSQSHQLANNPLNLKEFFSKNVKYSFKYHSVDATIGWIRDNKFMFFYKPKYITNSSATVMRGLFYEKDGYCHIDYNFSKFYETMVFGWFFILFSLLISLIILSSDPSWVVIIPISFVVFGYMGIFYKSKKRMDKLVEILKSIALVNQNEANI